AHLFICTSCTYNKSNGAESSPDEAYALRKNLKTRARELYSKNEVRVSASTCLGECDHGIAAVMYPSGEWTLGLRPQDEEKMLTKLTDEVNRLK
ncbi:MAG: (2Fe-2S) ferredoxin domain-containing protein, partial [Bdellovibrionales bacterium]|nr:(2Fe-2S) ferredoxin domain-containing protein [Bdellovibrionales bacterium]